MMASQKISFAPSSTTEKIGDLVSLAFRGWFQKTPDGFSHHRESNSTAIGITMACLSLIEGGLMHWWLSSNAWWIAASIAAGIHILGLLYIFGDLHALRLTPSLLNKNRFEIRFGRRARASIELSKIDEISVGEWAFNDIEKGSAKILFLGSATLKIVLKEDALIDTLFSHKYAHVLYLQIDDAARVCSALNEARTQ